MRLIDADAAVELLRGLGSRDYRREKGTIADAMKMLSHPSYTPTVDAVVLPCKVTDRVYVDERTLPYHYLHPHDGCKDFALCEVVSFVTTKKETYMKLRALYPSRSGRRNYLRYGIGAIGKTVFLTGEEAEAAFAERKKHERDTFQREKETKRRMD